MSDIMIEIRRIIGENWIEYRKSDPNITVKLEDMVKAYIYDLQTFTKWQAKYEDELRHDETKDE